MGKKMCRWTWTVGLQFEDGAKQLVPGESLAPEDATKDTLLPDVMEAVRSKTPLNFIVTSFSATRKTR